MIYFGCITAEVIAQDASFKAQDVVITMMMDIYLLCADTVPSFTVASISASE